MAILKSDIPLHQAGGGGYLHFVHIANQHEFQNLGAEKWIILLRLLKILLSLFDPFLKPDRHGIYQLGSRKNLPLSNLGVTPE